MPAITTAQPIGSIICPNCGNSGSLKSQLPPGVKVRCKRCKRSFKPAIEVGAISACEAVQAHQSDMESTRAGLAPQDTTSWRRQAPCEAADKNTESVRANAKTAVSSVIGSAKELGARARDYARSDEVRELADRALGKVKQASSTAKEHATDLTRRARDAAVATMPFWKRLFREIREIIGATARQTDRLIGYGYGIARTRVLFCKARGAELALGNRMYKAGVGDEAIRGQIASLDDRIASVELGKGSTKQMESEKKGLMIRLAADALAQDVAPTGAAAELGVAISARGAVAAHRSQMGSARTGLAPQDPASWRRIGLGYGVVMLALTFATALFLRSANTPSDATPIADVSNIPSDVSRLFTNDTTPTIADEEDDHPIATAKNDHPIADAKSDHPIVTAKDDHTIADAKEVLPREALSNGMPDPLVEHSLKVTSHFYTESGFSDYKFGDRIGKYRQVVEATELGNGSKQTAIDDTWLSLKDGTSLYFSSGQLVGIRRIYRRDLDGYITAAVEQFGKTPEDLIRHYDFLSRFGKGAAEGGYSVACYRFDKSFVYVFLRKTGELWTSFAAVDVFDRDFVMRIANEDIVQKKAMLLQVAKIVEHCSNPSFNWDTIPFPSLDGTKLIRATYGPNSRPLVMLIGRDVPTHGGWFDNHCIAVFETDESGSKELAIRVDLNRFPSFKRHPLLACIDNDHTCDAFGTLYEDGQILNSNLVQTMYPSSSETIRLQTVSLPPRSNPQYNVLVSKQYSWTTKEGWEVRILTNNTIVFVKPEKKRL